MNGNVPPTDAEQQVSLDLIIYSDERSHQTSGEHGLDSENKYSIQSIDERAHKSSRILEGIFAEELASAEKRLQPTRIAPHFWEFK